MNATVTPAITSTISPITRSQSMTSVVTEIVSCLRDLAESHRLLLESMRTRRGMISELNDKLNRNQEHGTEPTLEHVQVRAELYYLESAIARAERDTGLVQERIKEIQAAV